MIEEKCQRRDADLARLDERQAAEMTVAVDRANLDQADTVSLGSLDWFPWSMTSGNIDTIFWIGVIKWSSFAVGFIQAGGSFLSSIFQH